MSIHAASLIVNVALVYVGLGLLFAIPFAWRGAARIDPDAVEGSVGFRILIVPGAAALWPLLVLRWMRASARPVERGPHRDAARGESY